MTAQPHQPSDKPSVQTPQGGSHQPELPEDAELVHHHDPPLPVPPAPHGDAEFVDGWSKEQAVDALVRDAHHAPPGFVMTPVGLQPIEVALGLDTHPHLPEGGTLGSDGNLDEAEAPHPISETLSGGQHLVYEHHEAHFEPTQGAHPGPGSTQAPDHPRLTISITTHDDQPSSQGAGTGRADLTTSATSYYDQPMLKGPVWTWEVPMYFFVGGTAGGASVLAVCYGWLSDKPDLARGARWVACYGAMLSPALLIRDLGRPDRFLNMMRVIKWKSPMSVGSWLLAGFGLHATISAVGSEVLDHMKSHPVAKRKKAFTHNLDSDIATPDQMLLFRGSDAARARTRLQAVTRLQEAAGRPPQREEFRRAMLAATVEDAMHPERRLAVRLGTLVVAKSTLVSALCGSLLATYTGVLLGATANPVWKRHRALLPIHFGTAGLGSAVSVLEQMGHEDDGLHTLGVATAAVEMALGAITEFEHDTVAEPLHKGRSGQLLRAGAVLCGPVALGLRLLGKRSKTSRQLAGIAFIGGALLSRFGWIEAGKASARDSRAALQHEG